MTRDEKAQVIADLKVQFENNNAFYITDTGGMTVTETNEFRGICFKNGLQYKVVKNSLIEKALLQVNDEFAEFSPVLKGFSGIVFSKESPKAPAVAIKEFQKKNKEKLNFKGAIVESAMYIGADQLDTLANLKSREELIGDVIGLLQSPAKNVISALSSGGQTLSGIVKTLSEKEA